MNCPECAGKTRVVDSSYMIDQVTRKRECKKCNHTFFTEEKEVKEGTKVITRHQMLGITKVMQGRRLENE